MSVLCGPFARCYLRWISFVRAGSCCYPFRALYADYLLPSSWFLDEESLRIDRELHSDNFTPTTSLRYTAAVMLAASRTLLAWTTTLEEVASFPRTSMRTLIISLSNSVQRRR